MIRCEPPLKTCWDLIAAAARGEERPRAEFAWRYESVVRTALNARWKGSRRRREVDDAVQEVFLECFRHGGALSRVRPEGAARFRTYLSRVAQNVARRVEERSQGPGPSVGVAGLPDQLAAADESLSRAFDRAWAQSMVREARAVLERRARQEGERSLRRVRLLDLRASEGLPIREIARVWNVDAAFVHHEYARARDEFRDALAEIILLHDPHASADLASEYARIRALLD